MGEESDGCVCKGEWDGCDEEFDGEWGREGGGAGGVVLEFVFG
jgi:hypothetical protein